MEHVIREGFLEEVSFVAGGRLIPGDSKST